MHSLLISRDPYLIICNMFHSRSFSSLFSGLSRVRLLCAFSHYGNDLLRSLANFLFLWAAPGWALLSFPPSWKKVTFIFLVCKFIQFPSGLFAGRGLAFCFSWCTNSLIHLQGTLLEQNKISILYQRWATITKIIISCNTMCTCMQSNIWMGLMYFPSQFFICLFSVVHDYFF